jgi:phage regulator Rha-like protein
MKYKTKKPKGKSASVALVPTERVESCIYEVRGKKVIVDSDLAAIYGVETRVLNQAVKRNAERFPADFVFQLTKAEVAEWRFLRSQSVILKSGQHLKYLPYAFTEHGAIMAATVLNSPQAVQMSLFVVRAFVKMRETLAGNRELSHKLEELERKLTERLDDHEGAIRHLLDELQQLVNPPEPPEPPRRQIGFHVQERKAKYRTQKLGRKSNREPRPV